MQNLPGFNSSDKLGRRRGERRKNSAAGTKFHQFCAEREEVGIKHLSHSPLRVNDQEKIVCAGESRKPQRIARREYRETEPSEGTQGETETEKREKAERKGK